MVELSAAIFADAAALGGGARIEIAGGVSASFPAGWQGRCDATETVRKVYMIA